MTEAQTMSQWADAQERMQLEELNDKLVTKSLLYALADGERGVSFGQGTDKQLLMGEDPRLPKMPAQPTLMDFFRLRFSPGSLQHLLQSANLAQKNGLSETLVLACLLHDIAVAGFIRSDHGYWGAQLIEPYVDEEASWAIRYHQALRFYPDESVGYPYPENYVRMFGGDYVPDPYIRRDYAYARKHKWYMSARMICVNDLYSFDPDVVVTMAQFEDIIGRHFKQPKEGLGNDNTPS
ncbi:MAG: HD domain-containing protein, partial [Stellaceae bacterium]